MNFQELTTEQLRTLNKEICTELKRRQGTQIQAAAQQFKVGDKVTFTAKGRRVVGVVSKINPKTMKVDEDRGQYLPTLWTVTPTLCQKVS